MHDDDAHNIYIYIYAYDPYGDRAMDDSVGERVGDMIVRGRKEREHDDAYDPCVERFAICR